MMRVICLIDRYSNSVRSICNLRYCIYDQTIILLSIVGCNHIQPVSDVEKCRQIIFIRCLCILCNIVYTKLIGQFFQLFTALFIQCWHDAYCILCIGQIFALLQHAFHNLCSHRSPGTVFDKCHRSLLVVALSQMIDKFAHERENVCVVSRGGKYQLVVAECIFYSFGHIRTCKVMQFYFRAAFCTEFICQCIDGFLRIAIYGSISDHNSFGFCFVGRPCVVKSKVISQIFFQNRSVQRANRLNIQPCRFLQKVLYLSAVFSYDSDIITTSFACPVIIIFYYSKFTKCICWK